MGTKILGGMAMALAGLLLYHITHAREDAERRVRFPSPEGGFEILMPGEPVTGKVIELQLPKFTANCIPSQP